MALLSDLFQGKNKKVSIEANFKEPQDDSAIPKQKIKSRTYITFDTANDVRHTYRAIPTKNPIEGGGNVSDHVTVEPIVLSMKGFMSEAPFSLLGSALALAGGLAGAAGPAFTGAIPAIGGLFNNDAEKPKQAFDMLTALMNDRLPIAVVTGLNSYNNMIVTSFEPTETAATGNSLSFDITFSQVLIVASSQTDVLPGNTKSGAGGRKKGGSKGASALSDGLAGAQAKASSLINNFFFGGL